MKIENYSSNLDGIILDPNIGRYTCFADVQAIIAIIRDYSKGNIIEIGCALGTTTRDLSINFPDRAIYAIDSTDNSLHKDQENEKPNKVTIGFNAINCANVKIIDRLSYLIDYSSFKDIGAIFIDADHTYEGVKRDTEKILHYFAGKNVVVIWHDYYDDLNYHPWIGVKKYIDETIATKYEVYRVLKTNLVWAII